MKAYAVLATSCKLIVSAIVLQTLYFKFTADPESVYIFSKVGLEPRGRIVTGCFELAAVVLIWLRAYSWLGSFLSSTVMIGAVFSHFTLLGFEVSGDHGLLFTLSILVLVCSLTNLYLEREKIPWVGELLAQNFNEPPGESSQ